MVVAEFSPETLSRLARNMAHWQRRGFTAVSLPWIASPTYTEALCPPQGVPQPELGPGRLVASGEQAFLQLAAEGKLPPGKAFVGWSPCVRLESTYDRTHHLYFMKVELFVLIEPGAEDLVVKDLLAGSLEFNELELLAEGVDANRLYVRETGPSQWDIELDNVELGSYGTRELFGINYAYGTGCAEPRFSHALRRSST